MSKAINRLNALADLIESTTDALSDTWKVNRTMLFLTETAGLPALEKAMGRPMRYIEVLMQEPLVDASELAGGQVVDLPYVFSVDVYFEYEPDLNLPGSSYEAFLEAMTAEDTGVVQVLYETFFTGGFSLGNPVGVNYNTLRLVDSKQNKLAHFTTFTIEVY